MRQKDKVRIVREGSTFDHPGITGPAYYRVIAKDAIKVDHTYQRPLFVAWVRRLIAAWCDALCGTIYVSRHPDGTFWIVDGQQRHGAATQIGSIKTMRCMVIPTDGKIETDAWLFRHLNVNLSLKPHDKYRAELVAGVEDAVAVRDIVASIGYTIPESGCCSSVKRTINCIQKLRELARRDVKLLTSAMKAAEKIYDGDKIDGRVLNGLFFAEVHLRNIGWKGGVFSTRNMRLLVSAGHDTIVRRMAEAAAIFGKAANNVGSAQANGIIALINHGRHSDNRIPVIVKPIAVSELSPCKDETKEMSQTASAPAVPDPPACAS